ncbi:pyridoxal phosphate-dependent decarboxylase family protein [Micromonospora ureilytica]|uniref:Glutamate/tyrosine decarboxylase-like PLP-dependent enzyme n=1 Tax=Micromonospora ureilytica TaxID=709868 RepID=A0ABS0JQW7_9ACTN|nr:aminotransferase class V-fold PLP-dependent enzyme [Micromonospora ureilytica]MBG6069447.1 glutamate/tyrosine decarboxylase-like PLP-dependent enzyme [Micromonospora ureilytica]WSR57279.1 aminotransferase class V-fold PLP-dependent enzyme [Micromonospora ureilytica]
MIDENRVEAGALSAAGVPAERVLEEVRQLRGADRPTHGGRLFAYVYDPAVPGLDELAASAHRESAHVNGLDPTAFPSLLAMENALVGAAGRVLGAGPGTTAPDVVGSVTSGGTESLILAVKAARDAHPEITEPRILVPSSAHAAFAKAAHYLRVALDVVPVSPDTLRPDPAAMAAAIRPETVLVACSAPSYAHGVVDPVTQIAAAAAEAGVRCHVDACFGGWTLPYLRRLGEPVPAFDFAVPGVTSISVDLHKYAYAPKGVSVLLHRDATLRAPQYFAYADWPGYTMINPVIASTRSGGPIAAAYATVRHLGDDGYLRLAAVTRDAVAGLADAVRAVDGLRLMAEPESTVVCFTATEGGPDLFVLVDELTARGWHTQPQLSYAGLPASVHLTVTAAVAPRVAEFGPDLTDAVAAARSAGPVRLPAELTALVGALTPEALTPDLVVGLAAGLGLGGEPGSDAGPLPERMALVNTLLDAAPSALRERLLVEFVSLLQRPTWAPS